MDSNAWLVVLGIVALVLVLFVVGTLVLLIKYRPPGKGIAAAIAALVYTISPVDAVPEVLLGPIGLVDDLAVIIGTFLYVRGTIAELRRGAATGQPYRPQQRPARPARPAPKTGLPRQDPPNPRVRD